MPKRSALGAALEEGALKALSQPSVLSQLLGDQGKTDDLRSFEEAMTRQASDILANLDLIDPLLGLRGRAPRVRDGIDDPDIGDGVRFDASFCPLVALATVAPSNRLVVTDSPSRGAAFITTGSAYSQRLLRAVQGHNLADVTLERRATPVVLPSYVHEYHQYLTSGLIRSYVNRLPLYEFDWAIHKIDEFGRETPLFHSSVDAEGFLSSDMLVWTRIRARSGTTHTYIDGLHAAATAASTLVLTRRELLQRLLEFAQSGDFTAAIAVKEIGYDHRARRMWPKQDALEIVDMIHIRHISDELPDALQVARHPGLQPRQLTLRGAVRQLFTLTAGKPVHG